MKPPFINCLFKDIETNGGGSVMVSHNNCLAYLRITISLIIGPI